MLKQRRPLCGYTDESLHNLLAAQEYPEGEFAEEIELEQTIRRARKENA